MPESPRFPRSLLSVCFLFLAVVSRLAIAQAGASPAPPGTDAKLSTIKTIYVMPSSHWDLGFTAPPEEVLPRLKPHIDEVIANAKRDPEFRWTIESVWQIREWLARTSEGDKKDSQQIQDFVDLVNKGQIQVSAVFGSMHTEFMGAEQLNRITYDMTDLEISVTRRGLPTQSGSRNFMFRSWCRPARTTSTNSASNAGATPSAAKYRLAIIFANTASSTA